MSGSDKPTDQPSINFKSEDGSETTQTSLQPKAPQPSVYSTPNTGDSPSSASPSQETTLPSQPPPKPGTTSKTNGIQTQLDSETQANSKETSGDDTPLLNQASESTPSYVPEPNLDHGLKPRIVVIGVGGAGCNAITNMIKSELVGVEFIVTNTDAQALEQSDAASKIQLGLQATHGLGAGSHPEMGRASAEESIQDVLQRIGGSHMLFVTAGMGGGTGTGAAPVIAKAAREHGILTVGVVTKPFHFEGAKRMRVAETGIEELQKYVDTLIVIPNQNLFRVANEKTTFVDAFKMADEVLYSGVRSVTDLMMKPGLINLDFADVKAVMGEMMGKAMMGTGEAEGDGRAIDAAEAAISSPLLDDVSMKGAKAVLINITGGMDMTLFEADEAANRIREEVDPNAHIIFGSTFDEGLQGKIRVSCVATGIDAHAFVAASVSQASSRPERREPIADSPHPLEDNDKPKSPTEMPTSQDAYSSPRLSAVEEELGVSFEEEEFQTETEAETESTYDIYSSLRKDINEGSSPSEAFAEKPSKPLTEKPSETFAERPPETFKKPEQPVQHKQETHPVTSSPQFRPRVEEDTSPPKPMFQSPPQESERQRDDTGEQEHRSFFSRLMGRKKNTPKTPPATQRQFSKPKPTGFQRAETTSATEQDDLDVPAFLRRKDRH